CNSGQRITVPIHIPSKTVSAGAERKTPGADIAVVFFNRIDPQLPFRPLQLQ
ncbi:hypothetical protein P3T16_004936, partial [Paraburkholderia sp. GAS42]